MLLKISAQSDKSFLKYLFSKAKITSFEKTSFELTVTEMFFTINLNHSLRFKFRQKQNFHFFTFHRIFRFTPASTILSNSIPLQILFYMLLFYIYFARNSCLIFFTLRIAHSAFSEQLSENKNRKLCLLTNCYSYHFKERGKTSVQCPTRGQRLEIVVIRNAP